MLWHAIPNGCGSWLPEDKKANKMKKKGKRGRKGEKGLKEEKKCKREPQNIYIYIYKQYQKF